MSEIITAIVVHVTGGLILSATLKIASIFYKKLTAWSDNRRLDTDD